MKAKKFVKKVRKLLGPKGSEIAQFLGGDSSTMTHRGLLLNLQVLCEEYVVLERARRIANLDAETVLIPADDLRKSASKVQVEGNHKVTLPKGYRLFASQGTDNRAEWTLMRRGHLIGYVAISPGEDGADLRFRETHAASDVGHDCIDFLQDAVDSLISTHEEYIASKNKRKSKSK